MTRFTNKLQGQTAIILGGTGGVGMSIACGLLEFGASVIITSSRAQKLETQLCALRSQYPDIPSTALTGFTCDLGSSAHVEANVATLVDQVRTCLAGGRSLNHFVYTAGDSLPTAALEEFTRDRFHAALQVRVTSCVLAVQAFVPLLPKSNKSSITLTGGSICEKPIAGGWAMLAFIASGLNGLTRQLAADLAPIRVNCVAPGVVDTDLWSGMSEEQRKVFYESMGKQLPTGTVGSSDDVAESYLYLLKDANITGSTVHTNGGTFLQ